MLQLHAYVKTCPDSSNASLIVYSIQTSIHRVGVFKKTAERVIDLINRGQQTKAREQAQTLTGKTPKSAEDFNSIGLIYYHLFQIAQSIPFFQKAVQLDSTETAYLNNLALSHLKLGQNAHAAKLLLKALKINPDDAVSYFNLAVTFQNNNNLEKALEYFKLAYDKNPKVLSPLIASISVLEKLGRVEDAESLCHKILADNPNHAEANIQLAVLLKNKKQFDSALTALNRALKQRPNSAHLHYERGHVLHALKRYDEAWESFEKANHLHDKKLATRVQFENENRQLQDINAEITKLNLNPQTVSTSAPIYIVGSPRSGTTLLAQMLDMHPDMANAGELEITRFITNTINQKLGSPNNMQTVLYHLWFDATQSQIEDWRKLYNDLLTKTPQHASHINLIDKMPSNARRLALISKLFPRAPIIHIIRDGREVAFSAFSQNFINYVWHSHNVFDALTEWKSTIELARATAKTTGIPYLEVRYEDLVLNPRSVLETVLKFLNKDWHEDCLKFHENKSQTFTASYNQVREQIYTSSISKARFYPEIYAEMTEFAKDMLSQLGYL